MECIGGMQRRNNAMQCNASGALSRARVGMWLALQQQKVEAPLLGRTLLALCPAADVDDSYLLSSLMKGAEATCSMSP
eukprot:scaffold95038_cov16-Prasinocladus_malaysianus.AAC.5